MFDLGSNRTQGARSTMVGPCGPGGFWSLTTLGRARRYVCHYFISLEDLEAAGAWSQLEGFKDPELQRLALGVLDMLLSGKADSTTKKYIGAFRRWKLWAEARQEVPSFLLKRPM